MRLIITLTIYKSLDAKVAEGWKSRESLWPCMLHSSKLFWCLRDSLEPTLWILPLLNEIVEQTTFDSEPPCIGVKCINFCLRAWFWPLKCYFMITHRHLSCFLLLERSSMPLNEFISRCQYDCPQMKAYANKLDATTLAWRISCFNYFNKHSSENWLCSLHWENQRLFENFMKKVNCMNEIRQRLMKFQSLVVVTEA